MRHFRGEDETAVLAMLQVAFGRWPRGLDGVGGAEFFAWKHRASPFGPSTLLVAELAGSVVGFVGLMPWRLRFSGQIRQTIRGVDLVVDPSHRRRGVSMRLIEAVRDSYGPDIALGWSNPNERSRPGVLKSGRERVAGLPTYITAGLPAPGASRRGAAPGRRDAAAQDGTLDAAAALGDDELFARVLSRDAERRDRIATARDVEFLRWRYGQSPVYRASVASRNERVAIAIFRVQQRGRLRLARICELLPGDGDVALARRLVRDVRRASAAHALTCAFPASRTAALCGFVRSPRATIIAANQLHHDLVPDPTSPRSWALSLGDLELI
ncbi:MAG TPA: GNAT family N-acetyltransferase [Solirubrobacteraceae bacterium]